MKRLLCAAGILCLLAPVAPADELPEALFARLEVGTAPGHFADLRISRTGTEWNVASLDLDGDGIPDRTFGFQATENAAGRPYTPRHVVIEHEGARWVLDLTYSRPRASGDGVSTYVRWSVTKGDFYAWFINGPVTLHASREAAAAAKPIRMGPPFTFATSTSTRGMQTLVNVGLKDGNGCTMRLARVGKEERKIRIRLLAKGEEALAEWATYG